MMRASNDNDPFATLNAQWIQNPERRFSVQPGIIEYLQMTGKIHPVDGYYNWGETIDALNEFYDSPDSKQPLWRLEARHNGEVLWQAARRLDGPHEWIYFIGADNSVKIGTSVSPSTRVKELQTGNWHELILFGVMQGGPNTEAELHALFSDLHIRGEWYRHERLLREFISENCSQRKAA